MATGGVARHTPNAPEARPEARHIRDPLDDRLAELTATHARVTELFAAKTPRRWARWRASQLSHRRPSSVHVGALGLSLSTAARETSGAAFPRPRRPCRPAAGGRLWRLADCSSRIPPDPLCAFVFCYPSCVPRSAVLARGVAVSALACSSCRAPPRPPCSCPTPLCVPLPAAFRRCRGSSRDYLALDRVGLPRLVRRVLCRVSHLPSSS